MQVLQYDKSRPIKAWVGTREVQAGEQTWELPDIEQTALEQLKNLATLPFIHKNGVAVMPDVHAGIGSTIGTVIATVAAVIPAAIGVDIGCGMNAVKLSIKADQLPDSLKALRSAIEEAVPTGTGPQGNHKSEEKIEDNYYWLPVVDTLQMSQTLRRINPEYTKKSSSQLGTLGSGNHFIEICIDEEDYVWVMLHSGSRGIGNMIGREFISKAKEEMERWHIDLPDKDLAYLPEGSELFDEYVEMVQWAQEYALENRKMMMTAVLKAIRREVPTHLSVVLEAVNCHHNYVEKENHFESNVWVTRKGAVSARSGQLGIIPGSMGKQSYIVRGKGNPESYCSCSHGAGRAVSRTEARKRFSLTDLIAQTDGVECRKDSAVIDEIPGAYKSLDLVMANQKDLVEVVHTLKAVLCVKGN